MTKKSPSVTSECAADDELIALDLSAAAVRALADQARQYLHDHDLPSLQVALACHGRRVLTLSGGEAMTRGGMHAAAADTLYMGFSTTKAVVAAAVWLLVQDGRLDVERRVAELVPEFGENGKGAVRVWHLLTHTAGFPVAPFDPAEWDDRSKRLARFAHWYLEWEPGSRYVYHPTSSMWVVAEIIERCPGMDFRDFIRAHVVDPLGLHDLHLGLAAELEQRVADVEFVGDMPATATPATSGIQPPLTASSEKALTELYNSRGFRAVGVPGGGGIMTAADLAMFYQALLDGGLAAAGRTIWTEEILVRARGVLTGELTDPMTGRRASRGLGIVVAGDRERLFRGFAKDNSAAAFGHMGLGGQVGWADPANGLSFAFFTNGHDRDPWRAGMRAITMSAKAVACVAR